MNRLTSLTPPIPDVALLRQRLFKSTIRDPEEAIQKALQAAPTRSSATLVGKSVAVAVGSRGIDRIDTIVRLCLQHLRYLGMRPFIVPAMGSHGGATADGQLAVLAKLGITESSMETPIRSAMTAESVGTLANGINLLFASEAAAADFIVVINRIKPHTKFNADIESGLCKMLTIGLGKAEGAAEYHRGAIRSSFDIIEDAARYLLDTQTLLFGVAIMEDGYGHLAHIEVVSPENILTRDRQLLKQVSKTMGRIPFDRIDLLIIDQIGKDFSGIGMDSNVTGRHRDLVGDFYTAPHVKRIFVRELSPGSDGNANGIGLADFTTRRLVDEIDLQKTYTNAIVAVSPEKAALPMYFDTDREAIAAALQTIGVKHPEAVRLVQISNTAHLESLAVSKAFDAEIDACPGVERLSPFAPLRFDDAGNLFPLAQLC